EKVADAVVVRRRTIKQAKRAPGEGAPAGPLSSSMDSSGSCGGRWRTGGGGVHGDQDGSHEHGRSLVESGEGSCKRELAGSIGISPAAANGHATAFSTKMKGLRRNHNCGTIADAIAGLHAELHGDGSGIVVYGVDGVTGSGSGVRNGGEVESVFWCGEVEYEEVTVWRRDRILGRWLRRLWMSHPSTRPAIQDCLFRHLHAPFWRTVLMAIVNQQASRLHLQLQLRRSRSHGRSVARRKREWRNSRGCCCSGV
ncbi:hypothetical protein Vafri_18688, partial [Volvox africanus]